MDVQVTFIMPQIHVHSSISLCIRRSLRFGAVAPIVLLMLGCATVAKVTNLSDEPCKASFSRQLSSVLKAEGEKPEAADALATKTVSTLTTYDLGPRPFAIAAPSGTDYRFFVDRKGTDCVLTLYGRRKGFVSYTNNLTYIATEPLPDCTCAD
jgi:hypothetical protein